MAKNSPFTDSTQLDSQATQHTVSASDGSNASTILDMLAVLTKYRKFISWFVMIATVTVTVVALLTPKWYKSTASVFPAEKADLLTGLEGISSIARQFSPAKALTAFGTSPETDRYMAILKSGTVLSAVIQKFDLIRVYDITSYPNENTIKELTSNVELNVEPEGNIVISVYDRDPQRAADMANYFVELLNKTNMELNVQNARGNREFIESRYKKNLADLAQAEDSLKSFQQRYGIIALPEQTEASIKAAAEISAQLALKEVEVGVLRRTQTTENPTLVAAQIQLDEMRGKIRQMSTGPLLQGGQMNVFVPFAKVPELGGEYVRRFREVEIQYKILQILTPMFEQAKVEERRQTPSVVVLDRAAPAERKAKPKVSLYTLLALTISLVVALAAVFTIEGIKRLRRAHSERLNALVATAWSDWFGLRLRRKRS